MSITKNFETLFKQTHTKSKETLEFKLNKSRQTFSFEPSLNLGLSSNWMIRLTSLEVHISVFNITEENCKFEFSTFPDSKIGAISYEKVRSETGKDLEIANFTAADLQDEVIAPMNIDEYRKQVTKRMKNDEYMRILATYISSEIQDFESALRTEIYLAEDDIRLVLDENNSSFITYELQPGIYTFKDLFEALFNMLQP